MKKIIFLLFFVLYKIRSENIIDRIRNLENTDGEDKIKEINYYIPCTTYLFEHPQINKTFKENLIFPPYYQKLDQSQLCGSLENIYLNFIVTRNNIQCDFKNYLYLRLDCQGDQNNQNILSQIIEINDDQLIYYDKKQDEEDGEYLNEGINYPILNNHQLQINTDIVPILENFQFRFNGQNLIIILSNFHIQHCPQPMLYIQNIQKIQLNNMIFYDQYNPYYSTIRGSAIQNIEVRNCTFENPEIFEVNRVELIYLTQSIGQIQIYDSIFKNGNTQYSGSAISLSSTNLYIFNTKFINCISQGSGVIFLNSMTSIKLEDIQIIDGIVNKNGGGINIENSKGDIILNNVQIINCKALGDYGGAIYIKQSLFPIQIINSIFSQNQVKGQGGALYLNNTVSVDIQDTIIQQNQSLLSSGIYLGANKLIFMDNVQFISNTFINEADINGKVGGLHIDNISTDYLLYVKIILKNLKFENNIQFETGALKIENIIDGEQLEMESMEFNNNEATYYEAGAVYLFNIQIPYTFKNIQFNNNIAAKNGGSIFLYKADNLVLQNIDINKSSSQMSGGSIYFEGDTQNILFSNINIKDTVSEINGGAIYIQKGNNIQFENISITDINTKKVGAVYLQNIQQLNIIGFQITNASSYSTGGLYLETIKDSSIENLTIQNCVVEENNGGAYFFLITNTNFKNIQIVSNTAQLSTGGLTIVNNQNINFDILVVKNNTAVDSSGGISFTNSDNIIFNKIEIIENSCQKVGGGIDMMYITNSQFNNGKYLNNQANLKTGGALSIDTCQGLKFTNSEFIGNKAMTGGAIYMITLTNITFNNALFEQNEAGVTGGAIFMSESQELTFKDLIVNKNIADQNGGGLTIVQVSVVDIFNVKINHNIATFGDGGGCYFVDRVDEFKVSKGEIKNNKASNNGGGIFLDFINKISLQNIEFDNNQSDEYGGSVYLFNSQFLKIQSSSFKNHQGNILYGSCIFVYDQKELELNNNVFVNNLSLREGGTIKSSNTKILKIKNNIFSNNTVSQNVEQSSGGTLYIDSTTTLEFNGNQIENSYANYKGGCIYLMNVVETQMDNNSYKKCLLYFDENIPLEQKTVDYNITLGGAVYYEIRDIILVQQNNEIKFALNSNQFNNNKASSGGGLLINQNFDNQVKFQISNNTFQNNIADVGPIIRMLGRPSDIQISQLNNNRDVSGNIALLSKNTTETIYLSNEKLDDKQYAQFELCDVGQNLKEGGQSLCEPCNENGVCDGGYTKMYPKPQYWRFNKDSDEYFYCESNPDACLGNDVCKEGHTGLLCEQCDRIQNYSESKNGCSKCSPQVNQYISVVIMFMITCTLLGNQIYGLSSRIKKRMMQKCITKLYDLCFQKVSQLSGVTKIFLMHAQIMYLVATYKLEFPYEITSSIEVIGNPHTVFSNSLNCLIPVEDENDIQTTGYYMTYYGLAITVGTLIFLILIEILLYLGTSFIKHREQLVQYFQGSVVCFFLMIQPGLLQNSLQFIVCRDVGQNSFSSADTNINCQDKFYKSSVLPINLCVVALIGIIIPLILAYLLVRYKRQNLLRMAVIQRCLGILYMEVRHQYYYWEIVAIIIKIIVVAISITFAQQIIIKGCLSSIVLIMYLVVCYKLKPFSTKNLNNLSIIATVTQTLSIILIMCTYEMEEQQIENWETITLIPISIIIIMNVVFFGYAGLLILYELNQMFRVTFLKYSQRQGKLRDHINSQIQKEKVAKETWKIIKIGIHHSSMAKRRLKKNNPLNVKLNTDQMFYDYLQNAFENRDTIKYLDVVKLEQQQLDNIIQYVQTQIQSSQQNLSQLQMRFSMSGICSPYMENNKIKTKKDKNIVKINSPYQQMQQSSQRKLINKYSSDQISSLPTTKLVQDKNYQTSPSIYKTDFQNNDIFKMDSSKSSTTKQTQIYNKYQEDSIFRQSQRQLKKKNSLISIQKSIQKISFNTDNTSNETNENEQQINFDKKNDTLNINSSRNNFLLNNSNSRIKLLNKFSNFGQSLGDLYNSIDFEQNFQESTQNLQFQENIDQQIRKQNKNQDLIQDQDQNITQDQIQQNKYKLQEDYLQQNQDNILNKNTNILQYQHNIQQDEDTNKHIQIEQSQETIDIIENENKKNIQYG